jgi:hypothetical protein
MPKGLSEVINRRRAGNAMAILFLNMVIIKLFSCDLKIMLLFYIYSSTKSTIRKKSFVIESGGSTPLLNHKDACILTLT